MRLRHGRDNPAGFRWLGAVAGLALASFTVHARAQTEAAPDATATPAASPAPVVAATPFGLEGPERLVLGDNQTGVVRYRVPSGEQVRLHVNVGTLSQPTPAADGTVEVTYTPPTQKFPQVAIVAAMSADGSVHDWIRIPLYGSANVQLRTEPNIEMRVLVGTVQYGPVRADRKGRATVPVLVPPGVADAISVATDAAGNEVRDSLPLGVPAFGRVLAVCPPRGRSLFVFSVDEHAEPAATLEQPVTGDPVVPRAPVAIVVGVHEVPFDVPSGVRAGTEATLRVLVGTGGAVASECRMPVPLELPTALSLTAEQPNYQAGAGAPVRVTATLVYPGLRDAEPVTLDAVVDHGTVSTPTLESPSVSVLQWTVADAFDGRTEATLRVRARGVRPLEATVTLLLQPGPLAQLSITGPDRRLLADGKSHATLTVVPLDAHGNRVSRVNLSARAGGTIGAFTTAEGGAYEADYVAPLSYDQADDVVDIVGITDGASGVGGTFNVRLLPRRHRFVVHGRVGYLTNLGKLAGPLIVAGAGVRLPFANENLIVGAELGFYTTSDASEVSGGGELVDTSVSAVPLLARAEYQWRLGTFDVMPAVGAGITFASTEVSSPSSGNNSVASGYLLLSASLAGALPLGPGRVRAEFGLWYAPIDEPFVQGNLGGLHAALGYALEL